MASDYAQFQVHSAYEILAVEPSATTAEILSSYKKVIAAVHPDIRGEATNTLAQLVNEAKRVLIEEREDYDRWRLSAQDSRNTEPDPGPKTQWQATERQWPVADPWDWPAASFADTGWDYPQPTAGFPPPSPFVVTQPQQYQPYHQPPRSRSERSGRLAERALVGGFVWYARGVLAVLLLPPVALIYTIVAWVQLGRLRRRNPDRRVRRKRLIIAIYGAAALYFTASYTYSIVNSQKANAHSESCAPSRRCSPTAEGSVGALGLSKAPADAVVGAARSSAATESVVKAIEHPATDAYDKIATML